MASGTVATKNVSPLIDGLRGVAALLVFIGHLRNLFFEDFHRTGNHNFIVKAFYGATGLGHQAVILFFLLSGMLVGGAVVTQDREQAWDWKKYAVDRVSRLVPVLVVALLIGAACDRFGLAIFSSANAYGGAPPFHTVVPGPVVEQLSLATFFGNMVFLQTILVPSLGSNGPLWSLSNEFWYYVLFPACWTFTRPSRRSRRSLVISAAIVAFVAALLPAKILVYFIIWCMGVGAVVLPRFGRRIRKLVLASGLIGTGAALAIARSHTWSELPADFVLAVGVSTVLWAAAPTGAKRQSRVSPGVARLFSILAASSFTLYLFHLPMLMLLQAALQGPAKWPLTFRNLATAAFVAMVCWCWAYLWWWLVERRTPEVRAWLRSKIEPKPSALPQVGHAPQTQAEAIKPT